MPEEGLMFVSTNRLRTERGRGWELEDRFRRSSRVAEAAEGFIRFEMWKAESGEDYDEYLVVTHWESREAHRQFTRSDAFKQAHSGGVRADYIIGHPHLTNYDVRIASRAEAEEERVLP